MNDHFVSGGRNPSRDLVCNTCLAFHRDRQHWTHGWCRSRNSHSVSITGGCDYHTDNKIQGEINNGNEKISQGLEGC